MKPIKLRSYSITISIEKYYYKILLLEIQQLRYITTFIRDKEREKGE